MGSMGEVALTNQSKHLACRRESSTTNIDDPPFSSLLLSRSASIASKQATIYGTRLVLWSPKVVLARAREDSGGQGCVHSTDQPVGLGL